MITYKDEAYYSSEEAQDILSVGRERLNILTFTHDIQKYLIFGRRYYKKADIERLKEPPIYMTPYQYAKTKAKVKELKAMLDKSKSYTFHGVDYYKVDYLKELMAIDDNKESFELTYHESKTLSKIIDAEKRIGSTVSEGIVRLLTGVSHEDILPYITYDKSIDMSVFDKYPITRSHKDFVFGSQIRKITSNNQDKFLSLIKLGDIKAVRIANATLYSNADRQKIEELSSRYQTFSEFSFENDIKIGVLKESIPEEFIVSGLRIPLIDVEKAVPYFNMLKDMKQDREDEQNNTKREFKSARLFESKQAKQAKKKAHSKQKAKTPKKYEDLTYEEFVDSCTSRYIDELMSDRPDITNTIRLADKYLRYTAFNSTSKNPINSYRDRCARLTSALRTLNKEVNECTVAEQHEFVETLNYSKQREVVSFFKYISPGSRCPISVAVHESEGSKPYTDNEWIRFLELATDCKRHIPQAEASLVYAQSWLLLLCHSFLSWRIKDYLKFPKPSLIIDQECDGTITEAKAIIVAQSMRELCHGLTAEKTGEELQFPEIPRPILVPFATALSICMMHNDAKMFSQAAIRDYRKRYEESSLKEAMEGFDFYSMKCNKTIETGIWKHAVKLSNINTVAYTIAAGMRAHKKDPFLGLSETTEHYIMPEDNFNTEIQQNICKRGLFGFNAENILSIMTYGYSDSLSLSEKTNAVVKLNNSLPQSVVNSLAERMNKTLDKKRSYVQEWQKNPEVMSYRLAEALKCDSNSKLDSVVCSKLTPCDSTTRDCKICFYGLFTLQALPEIGRKTIEAARLVRSFAGKTDIASVNSKKVAEKKLAGYLELIASIRSQCNEQLKQLVESTIQIDMIKEVLFISDNDNSNN